MDIFNDEPTCREGENRMLGGVTGSPIANVPSDPYLIGFYDKKKVSLSHDRSTKVKFTIEVNPMGHGPWMVYKQISVESGKTIDHLFEDDFQVRWVRIIVDKDCKASAWFVYE